MPSPKTFISTRRLKFSAYVGETWRTLRDVASLRARMALPRFYYRTSDTRGEVPILEGSIKLLGLTLLSWRELPYEWVEYHSLAVSREFSWGPIERLSTKMFLHSDTIGETAVHVVVECFPRRPWQRIFAFVFASLFSMWKMRQIHGVLLRKKPYEKLSPRYWSERLRRQRMSRRLNIFRGVGEGSSLILNQLKLEILSSTDSQLARMRPYELAKKWDTNPYETLRVFLYSAKEGLLSLRWLVRCPGCRNIASDVASLAHVSPSAVCENCQNPFEVDFDRNLELVFSVGAFIRRIGRPSFEPGSPATRTHICVQQIVQTKTRKEMGATFVDEGLRCRTQGARNGMTLRPIPMLSKNKRSLKLTYTGEGWTPSAAMFRPGELLLELQNETDRTAVFRIERTQRDVSAVSATEVTALHEFRKLFSSEILSPGREINIRSLSVLFTDIRRSTSFYEKVGDGKAFSIVSKLTEFMSAYVQHHRGAIVKTMGDAVMAVFPSPVDAISAGIEIQANLPQYLKSEGLDELLQIKMGLHRGPALVFNSEGKLDYFGQTLNIAARIQNESVGSDIVFVAELLETKEFEALLVKYPLECVRFDAHVKGLEGEVRLCRLSPLRSLSQLSIA